MMKIFDRWRVPSSRVVGTQFRVMLLAAIFISWAALTNGSATAGSEGDAKGDSTKAQQFCGNTPFDGNIAKLLGISTNEFKEAPEIMDWKLTVHSDEAGAPVRYEMRCEYGVTVPNTPGLGRSFGSVKREGKVRISEGTKGKPNAVVYDLGDGVRLMRVHTNVLHILNADRSLMVGNGGWSYTLISVEDGEKAIDPAILATVPDMSYTIAPMSVGENVFGVFEGRSPCQEIAKQLKIPVHEAASKAKWRVTLYKNPENAAPHTYKIEGTLFRPAAREGKWTMFRGTRADPHATIIRLESKTEPVISLLRGDENVMFFLNEKGIPRVGHCEFSYTLNRREPAPLKGK